MSMFMIVAGGTGGHLFPAQALAGELRERGHAVQLITDLRARPLAEDFPGGHIHVVPSATPVLRNPVKLARAIFTILRGIVRSHGILRREKPDAVVGFGGYPAFPPLLAATLLGVPTILHEQNAVLGRANRAIARFAKKIAVSFQETRHAHRYRYKCILTGNPVRKAVIDLAHKPYPELDNDSPINILVTGGSQGAGIFSDIMPGAMLNMPDHLRNRIRLVQQCREHDLKRVTSIYADSRLNVELALFFKDLPRHIANSHLIICRAGASTVAELSVLGRPAIYVPLPGSVDQDQRENARRIAEADGGWVFEQGTLTPHLLAAELTGILSDADCLRRKAKNAMHAGCVDAVARLANIAENEVRQREGTSL